MFSIFNKAYPPPQTGVRSTIISLLFGVFIGLFLIFFEPFGLNTAKYPYKAFKLSFFGVITMMVSLIFFNLLPLLCAGLFLEKHWKVKHQLVFYFVMLFVIATCNGLYINYLQGLDFSWMNYWIIIKQTVVLGGIPLSFVVLMDYNRRMRLYIHEVKNLHLNQEKAQEKEESYEVQVFLDSKQNSFVINPQNILYAKAQGNYIFIYNQKEGEVIKTLHRISLTSFAQQLNSTHLLRCHRSFVVNLKKVAKVTGNAQGLKLKLEVSEEDIPVSRKYLTEIKSYFSEN